MMVGCVWQGFAHAQELATGKDTVAAHEMMLASAEADDTGGIGPYLQGAVSDLAGNPDAASKGYLKALGEDPDNLALRSRVLELSLMGGDIPTAVRLAKSLPEIDQTTMSRLLRAVDDAHAGKIKVARKEMRAAAKTAPGLLQFAVMQAYLDYADGVKVDKLVAGLEKVKAPGTLDGRRQFHIARLWLKAGEPEKGLAALEKAQKAEPSAIFTTLLLGQVYVQQGQPDKAAALFEEFRADNPAVGMMMPTGMELVKRGAVPYASTLDQDLASSMFDFALAVWGEGVLGPARQLMNLTLWLEPEQPYYRYYSGILLEMGRDFAAAEVEYNRVVEDRDLGPGVRLRLAEVHFKEGQQDKGWGEIEALEEEFPNETIVRRSAAQLAFERSDFKRAAKEYTALLDALPEDAETKARVELLFARGAAYERGHNTDDAEVDLKKALELAPANAQVMNYLGYMWVDNGEHLDEAFNLLKKAHLLMPEDGATTDSLGWAYHKAGEDETAAKYLEIAVEQDPESAEIADHLADVYAAIGRDVDAKKFYQLALELVEKGGDVPTPHFTKNVQKKLDKLHN